eukprot:5965971-Alexandrium_andersonii.AAC.1
MPGARRPLWHKRHLWPSAKAAARPSFSAAARRAWARPRGSVRRQRRRGRRARRHGARPRRLAATWPRQGRPAAPPAP